MTTPAASIIIPTRNRATILERTLRVLLQQGCGDSFEVIVVDDGSTDDTLQTLQRLRHESGGQIRYYSKRNDGPASARNIAMRDARGDILVFLGDDMVPAEGLLREHLTWHRNRYVDDHCAVLGRIEWDPALAVSPLMEFLNNGPQFRYNEISDKIAVDASYLVSSNVSFKASFVRGLFFDEDFRNAAWEDVEWAHRLNQKGMRLFYNSAALCFHFHPTTMKAFRNRNCVMGRDIRLLYEKHPELRTSIPEPKALRAAEKLEKWMLQLLYPIALPARAHFLLNPYFSLCLKEDMFRSYCDPRR